LGGAYWLFNMAYTQVNVFVVLAFGSKTTTTATATALSNNDLKNIATGLTILWAVAILLLLKCVNKSYRSTFTSRWTSFAFIKKRFSLGDDFTKMTILTEVHPRVWTDIEKAMKDWLGEIWHELHHHRPAWFTDELIEQIPTQFIPHIDLEKKVERKRRRSSVGILSTSVFLGKK